MSNVSYLLCASLLLPLLFHGSSACSWHKGPWFNRPRRDVQESLLDYTNSLKSDEQNVKHESNIKVALDKLREVLSSNDDGKRIVDPKVIEYFSKQQDFWLRSPFSEGNVTTTRDPPREACTIVESREIPKPLLGNSNDEFARSHFIINIPDFQQTAETYKCTNIGSRCGVDYYVTQPKPNPGSCKQSLRRVKVLVLPNTKQYFNINDFKVATFGVEDGCLCVKSQRIVF